MPTLANGADLAHIHLLLNHVPTVGMILALGLLLMSFVRSNDHLKKISFEIFFLIALAILPIYVSGVAAAEALTDLPDVSATAITQHQDAALWGLLLMAITGAAAWLGLWQFRRLGRPTGAMTATVLLLSVLTVVTMARVANVGGDIRHPEILGGQYSSSDASPDAAAEAAEPSPAVATGAIKQFVVENAWVWPTLETLHFLGMSLMFGVLMVVNFRLLGWLRGMSYAAVHRLLPFGILGFAVNFVTGMMFFIAASEQYTQNVAFHWKVLLLELAGVNFLVLTVFDGAWSLPEGAEPPLVDKLLAGSTLVLSIGVMYFGRMLPFIGNAF